MAKVAIKSEKLTPFGGFFLQIHHERLDVTKFGLKATSRIKAFVFKFISVP